jgi:tetratricopeptide (TPR) repeat protein
LAFLLLTVGGSKTKGDLARQSMDSLAGRRVVFNFGPSAPGAGAAAPAARGSGGTAGAGFFSGGGPSPVERELEEAMKVFDRVPVREPDVPGATTEQRQMYAAEMSPGIRKGNAALEEGNLAAAEELFKRALESADTNPYLQVLALGGLMEVYGQLKDRARLEEALKRYVEAMGKLPANKGTDLMAALRQGFKILRELPQTVDPGRMSAQLPNALPPGMIIPPGLDVLRGLPQALEQVPIP